MNCDQCNMLSINGIACHETGCPNTLKRYDSETDSWVKTYTCFECGCESDREGCCCETGEE